MKARGIVVVDYEFLGSLKEIAVAQRDLEVALAALMKSSPYAVKGDCDIVPRRGDKEIDLKKMKFRTS